MLTFKEFCIYYAEEDDFVKRFLKRKIKSAYNRSDIGKIHKGIKKAVKFINS